MTPPTPRDGAVRRTPLAAHWALARALAAGPGVSAQPHDAPTDGWLEIAGPTTVAAALRGLGRWSFDTPAQRFDADDWWFRAVFDAPARDRHAGERRSLEFGGLAGHAEVWLNGRPLVASRNMHLAHRCVEPALRPTGNELLLRFAALDAWLAPKRPRPRWRAPMVEHQQLRWTRNTLLGRTPGWSPPAAPVGPWRAIEWVEERAVEAVRPRLACAVDERGGTVTLDVRLAALPGAAPIEHAMLVVARDGVEHRAGVTRLAPGGNDFHAKLHIADAVRWWPHTHGEPALYDARLEIACRGAPAPVVAALGRIGFRTLTLDTEGGDFALRVNGVPVFCRGACWTPLDVASLQASPAALGAALAQVRNAGMNMLRVSGSMVAEEPAFHDHCDALGILVWQDFMFANMDYPDSDATFADSVRAEAEQQLARWHARPSLAVLCGNSEAEQQAAMWGSPREHWAQPLFTRDLAELAHAWCPGVPYWPSSAHGGAFPHQNDRGTTSYYGVGAYLRPLDDARRSGLRFATECLAFANVPPTATLARLPGGGAVRAHQPTWKARSPRDLGAGWDFDDVRDHYLERLFGVDPVALRSSDHERYLALGRVASAEAMAAAFAEWRRAGSGCRGALVWFLRDLWPGAGWGIVDDRGAPKAAFHALRRACAPTAAFFTDEGTNGLALHVVNDPGRALAAHVDLVLYRDDGLPMQRVARPIDLAPHSAAAFDIAAWFDGFVDLTRAYRFGPAEHALVVATLLDAGGEPLAEAFHFPEGRPSRREREIGLKAEAAFAADGSLDVRVSTRGFAQSVQFEVPGFAAEDDHFHLAPGATRRVRLVADGTAPAAPRGHLQALNAHTPAPLEFTL